MIADMAKLLISGIPGTGKTTVAQHLAEHFDFIHVDMEADSFKARRELGRDSEGFFGKHAMHDNVVLSWGFAPFIDKPAVERVLAAGYKFVWLDGDHVTSLRNFLERESNDPHKEADYYGQMQMILATEIIERLSPIQIDPFREAQFRPVQEIAIEIVGKVKL